MNKNDTIYPMVAQTQKKIIEFLQKVPLFNNLTEEEMLQISSICQERNFKKGHIIFYEDDIGTSFYLIAEGQVKIVMLSPEGREHILGVLQTHDFFGEMALLENEPRSATAIALSDAQVFIITREDFVHQLTHYPYTALRMLITMSRRLRKADRHVESLAFLSAPGRVARSLLELGEEQGKVVDQDIVVQTTMTRQELSNLAGTSRETLTRVLMAFQDNKLITLERGKIIIHNCKKLQEKSI